MKLKNILFYLIFSMLFFTSFVSENKSEILPKKEISETKIKSQKKNLVQSKKQKFNFKERLALKLVKKKIKKEHKKQPIKALKRSLFDIIFISTFATLILAGLVGGIIYLALGKTLLGILLIFGGLIIIPIIFGLLVVGFNLPHRENRRKKFKEYKQLKKQS